MELGTLQAIALFGKSHDPELLFWAAALLLNLTVTSDSVKDLIIHMGGLDVLLDLVATNKKEQVRVLSLAGYEVCR